MKTAPGANPGHLGSEAALLRRARHPSVVRPLEVTTGPDGPELVLVHAGDRTWASHPCGSARSLAAELSALAATVADLHAMGIAHGALDDPTHVIRGADDRPVLCGFGTTADRSGPDDPAGDTEIATDVVALGRLLTELVDALPEAERTGRAGRRLAALADSVTAGQVTSAAVLADRLAGQHGSTSAWPPAPSRRTLLGGAAVAALGLGIWLGALAGPSPAPPPHASGLSSDHSATTADPVSPNTTTTTDASTTTGATLDAPVRFRVVDHEGSRYRINLPGPTAMTLGDWDCNGTDTPAVLALTNGDVFVFDSWAVGDVELPARRLPGTWSAAPRSIAAAARDECGRLLVTTDEGLQILATTE